MVVMGRSGLRRHGLLGPRRAPEVPIRMTLKEPKISTFATIILNRKRFGLFFCCTQLASSSAVPGVLSDSQEELVMTISVRFKFISTKIRPKSPM